MSVELYPHQREALKKMHNGCILCGDVGSGKSLTSLAYFHVTHGGRLKPTFEKMSNPVDLYIITTARKRDTFEWEKDMGHLLLTTETNDPDPLYPTKVVVDSWNNINKYVGITGAFFIFDEQRVVGKGAWVKAFLKITKANEWILLSATPGDKWADYIPVFIANGFFKNRTEFYENHVEKTWSFTKYHNPDKYMNTGRLIRLRDHILVDMDFKRTTVQNHVDIFCDYDTAEYKKIMRTRWNYLKDEPIENSGELCYILRRVANISSDRMSKLIDIVLKKKKVIIFYNFDCELDYLKEWLGKIDDICIAEWNSHAHQEIPESSMWAYLVQYTAGCEGWNCIKTDTVIFYSQNYSYKVMVQAAGRINRLNTPFTDLYYYHMKSKAPIDLAIARAIEAKKEFNAERFVSKLSSSKGAAKCQK